MESKHTKENGDYQKLLDGKNRLFVALVQVRLLSDNGQKSALLEEIWNVADLAIKKATE